GRWDRSSARPVGLGPAMLGNVGADVIARRRLRARHAAEARIAGGPRATPEVPPEGALQRAGGRGAAAQRRAGPRPAGPRAPGLCPVRDASRSAAPATSPPSLW